MNTSRQIDTLDRASNKIAADNTVSLSVNADTMKRFHELQNEAAPSGVAVMFMRVVGEDYTEVLGQESN